MCVSSFSFSISFFFFGLNKFEIFIVTTRRGGRCCWASWMENSAPAAVN
ncbi:hypothetical protein D917_08016 [Trichinella nativa]|uniref:Uncharacterized protein n=1 Tax=Trichinella nativa TaxID=6335 RepID=A0A1Y3ERA1_9BILA|nr:hypothetical protein D917_08016 [Trichinella nativa]